MKKSRFLYFLIAIFVSLALVQGVSNARSGDLPAVTLAELPREAVETLELIKKGGPFPFAKDGKVFNNYENLLPRNRRGHYREFTVITPRLRHRGPKRIVVGGTPPMTVEYFYTDDHYATFRRIEQ